MLDLLHARAAVWLAQAAPHVVNQLWRATLFALLVVAIVRLGRPPRRSRQLLYALAFIAPWISPPPLKGGLRALWPTKSDWLAERPEATPAWFALDAVAAPVAQSPALATATARLFEHVRPRPHDERLCLAALLWLVGCGSSLAAWVRQLRGGRVARARELPELSALARLRAHFGLRRPVRVVVSEDCHEPAVHGHARPVIVVPTDLSRQMSSAELEALLAHEVAHVVRGDNLRSSLARVACSLLWFHPLAWWLAARLGEERELACDERALRATRDPDSYVGALEKTVRLCIARPVAGAASAGGTGVGRRLEQLRAPEDPGARLFWPRLIVPAALVGCVAFLVILPVEGHAALTQHSPHGRLFEQDLRGLGSSLELAAETVASLERTVASIPDDIDARGALLRHYTTLMMQSRETPEIRAAHERHMLWVIEHEPTSGLASSHFVACLPWVSRQACARARVTWMNVLTSAPAQGGVIQTAATYFWWNDKPEALRLLTAGRALEPLEPYWPRRLGASHLAQASSPKSQGTSQARDAADAALAELESARDLLRDAPISSDLLEDLSRAAWLAGDTAKTRRYATALVESARPGEWNYGNAIHDGHCILGELALASGDVTEAKRRLQMAGWTPGSATLNSFGPDLSLAAHLLERGEREAVIQYLEACARFWRSGQERLGDAVREIRSGGTPRLDRRAITRPS
jgi:beta-lactamase regulating signal transducer with metallopeptidase domain